MTVTHLGGLSIGQTIPAAVTAAAAGVAGINSALPDILARIAALQAFAPAPVSFTAQLVMAQQMVTGIQANIALGLPVPDIAAQIAMIAALIADLLAAVSAINAQLLVVTNFQALLGGAGVHAYRFAGNVSAFGTEMQTQIGSGLPGGSGGTAANALTLITTTPATWTAMAQVFKVSP